MGAAHTDGQRRKSSPSGRGGSRTLGWMVQASRVPVTPQAHNAPTSYLGRGDKPVCEPCKALQMAQTLFFKHPESEARCVRVYPLTAVPNRSALPALLYAPNHCTLAPKEAVGIEMVSIPLELNQDSFAYKTTALTIKLGIDLLPSAPCAKPNLSHGCNRSHRIYWQRSRLMTFLIFNRGFSWSHTVLRLSRL